MGLVRAKNQYLNPRFFLYYYLSPDFQGFLRSRTISGATVDRLALKDFPNFPVPTPPLAEQNAIAATLGALDDKIELNRQMNETLEAMARAIFKDWFVDFGPTRAKMEGRAPYLAPDIWSLFPDRLDDEGKPEGWRSGTLSDIVNISPTEPMRKGELKPYLDMAALPTRGSNADPAILRQYSSGTRFRNGDTLLARITPCLENGKTAFIQNLPPDTIGWGSTEFIVMRSAPPVPKVVSYLIAREPSFRRYAIQSMTGTSGRQRASADAIAAYPVALPPDVKLWVALEAILTSTFVKVAANAEESRTLAATRDLLLPKLMSGEIRVKDAERIVERTI
jgi:type I restriction enzyme S subunit